VNFVTVPIVGRGSGCSQYGLGRGCERHARRPRPGVDPAVHPAVGDNGGLRRGDTRDRPVSDLGSAGRDGVRRRAGARAEAEARAHGVLAEPRGVGECRRPRSHRICDHGRARGRADRRVRAPARGPGRIGRPGVADAPRAAVRRALDDTRDRGDRRDRDEARTGLSRRARPAGAPGVVLRDRPRRQHRDHDARDPTSLRLAPSPRVRSRTRPPGARVHGRIVGRRAPLLRVRAPTTS